MVKKLKNNDFLFKVLSVLIAVGLWFYVAYVENPDIEVWYDGVKLVYKGDETLSANGLARLKENEVPTISIKVKGTRNSLFALSSHDITAEVDVSDIAMAATTSLPVSVHYSMPGIETADRNPYNISVTTEKIISAEKKVDIEYTGEPAEGTAVEESSSSLDAVTVSGPQSVIEGITSCVAQLDISGISEDRTMPVKLRLKLSDGSIADDPSVELSNTFTDIAVKVSVTKNVPVKANISNLNEYNVKEIKITPESVDIKGLYSALKEVTEILTEPFEISASGSGFTKKLILPEGVSSTVKSAEIEVVLQ